MENSNLLPQKRHGGGSHVLGVHSLEGKVHNFKFSISGASPDMQLCAQHALLVTASLEREKPSASQTYFLPLRFPEI